MPELPEVETVRLALENAVSGKVIDDVKVRRRDLRTEVPESFENDLSGQKIESVFRRGKYLVIELSDSKSVIIHLGMSGALVFHHNPNMFEPDIHDHILFRFGKDILLVFNDPRRFGQAYTVFSGQLNAIKPFCDMGPEPLSAEFSSEYLAKALASKKGPIKNALMDQKVVAGLGNIYVCEALFYAGISPKRTARTIKGKRAEKLYDAIVRVLRRAIESGGSSLKDYRKADGTPGYFQHSFAVYDRAGRSCPDCKCDAGQSPRVDNIALGKGVKQIVQAGRSTFYCPVKQR